MFQKLVQFLNKFKSYFFFYKERKQRQESSTNSQNRIKLEDLVPELKNAEPIESLKDKIKPGDIVDAVMSGSLEFLATVQLGHRHRPHVVARVEKNHLTVYQGTSNKSHVSKSLSFYMSTPFYNTWKDGYIDLREAKKIPYPHVLSIQDRLTIADTLKINHIIASNKNQKYHPPIDMKIKIEKGFVVKKEDTFYYVDSVDKNKAIVYELAQNKTKVSTFVFSQKYYINLLNPQCIELNEEWIPITFQGYQLSEEIKEALHAKNQDTSQENCSKKTKNQIKSNPFEKHHYFIYPVGQIFSSGTTSVAYLFSYRNRDYGVYVDEEYYLPNLAKLDDLNFYHKETILDPEELLILAEDLVERDQNFKWLYDFILKQNENLLEEKL